MCGVFTSYRLRVTGKHATRSARLRRSDSDFAMTEQELECPICYAVPDGAIHQCPEGHWFCAGCDGQIAPRLPDGWAEERDETGPYYFNESTRAFQREAPAPVRLCPTCREPLPARSIRCRALERQIAGLPARCTHCGAATTRGEKAAHEAECPQQPRGCAAADVERPRRERRARSLPAN